MADVIGPNNYLPGQSITVPDGQVCDNHPERLATRKVVGESDSFGSEILDLCQECCDTLQTEIRARKEELQYCDWCKQDKTGVSHMRDIDEGMCGPVYNVCSDCRKKYNDALRAESDKYYDVY